MVLNKLIDARIWVLVELRKTDPEHTAKDTAYHCISTRKQPPNVLFFSFDFSPQAKRDLLTWFIWKYGEPEPLQTIES